MDELGIGVVGDTVCPDAHRGLQLQGGHPVLVRRRYLGGGTAPRLGSLGRLERRQATHSWARTAPPGNRRL
jgi:hypothetical protein